MSRTSPGLRPSPPPKHSVPCVLTGLACSRRVWSSMAPGLLESGSQRELINDTLKITTQTATQVSKHNHRGNCMNRPRISLVSFLLCIPLTVALADPPVLPDTTPPEVPCLPLVCLQVTDAVELEVAIHEGDPASRANTWPPRSRSENQVIWARDPAAAPTTLRPTAPAEPATRSSS